MTCKDCFNYEMCKEKSYQQALQSGRTEKDMEWLLISIKKPCKFFKEKNKIKEVVTCKECEFRFTTCCALWYGSVDGKDFLIEKGDNFYCAYGEKGEQNNVLSDKP